MDALRIFLYFTLLIGPLVLLHEAGHFFVARYFGVKCLEFSIGFGPRIFSWKPGETEYSLRLLPLGGFVRMLGEHEESTNPSDKGRAVNDQSLWKRALIFLAGPAMNLVIPVPVFFIFMMLAPGVLPPIVGTIEPGLPAQQAGLHAGDRITAIDGNTIYSFDHFQRIIAKSAKTELTLAVDRFGEQFEVMITPQSVQQRHRILPMKLVDKGMIGIHLTQYGAVVHVDQPTGAAGVAGLRTFDVVHSVNGSETRLWSDVEAALLKPGTHTLVILRPEATVDSWGDIRLRHAVTLTVPSGTLSELGLDNAQRSVWSVTPGSPAEQAGLRVGDKVLGVDGTLNADLGWVLSRLSVGANSAHILDVERDGEVLQLTITPDMRKVVAEFRSEREEVFIGLRPYAAMQYPEPEVLPLGRRLMHAATGAVRETIAIIGSLIMGVVMLFTGQVDSNSVGGPLMIADVASQAARNGLEHFIGIMALISINLGVLNLLPIPGLDGGQLAVLALEGAKRGPLSSRTHQMIQFVGVVMLMLLMLFVFKNDIERYWRSVADWLNA